MIVGVLTRTFIAISSRILSKGYWYCLQQVAIAHLDLSLSSTVNVWNQKSRNFHCGILGLVKSCVFDDASIFYEYVLVENVLAAA